MEFLDRRVRVLQGAESDLGREHAGEGGETVRQVGTIQEGIREYKVRLDGGTSVMLKSSDVEILD